MHHMNDFEFQYDARDHLRGSWTAMMAVTTDARDYPVFLLNLFSPFVGN